MKDKIKVGAVSYLNAKPLLYGLEQLSSEIELTTAYPSKLAAEMREGKIDLALLPVAAIPEIAGAHTVGEYGIAANGNVVSVALFSRVPLEAIETVLLDYQSRTSVRLTQLLFEAFWKKDVLFSPADEQYINRIEGTTAGVIIGDRALQQLNNFEFVYDLSDAWKSFTGLPFVFAAWVSNKDLPEAFIQKFDAANAVGLSRIDEIAAENAVPYYSLQTYYKDNICYKLDAPSRKGLALFLEMISNSR